MFVAADAARYQDAVDDREALVSIQCEEAEEPRAERLLREAGAIGVREEETPEPA